MGLFKGRLPASGLCRLDNCNNSERSSRRFMKSNPMTTDEASYQMLGQKTWSAILGYHELAYGHFWLSLLSECFSCYLYVFIVCSTRISWTGSIIGHEPNLLAMALSSGIAMTLLIFTFRTVHVNPALTISFLLTGRIPLIRALSYILVHCMGSLAAIAFLFSVSIKGHAGALGLDNPHETLTTWQILIVEIVISFVVTLATYATCNYSSYTCAKKITLEQYGRSCGLFQPSACDNSKITSASQRHLRCPVAPIVPSVNQLPSTSVTLHNPTRTFAAGDLMNMGNNGNNLSSNNHIGNGTRPYLISNHYNQVYDQYEDAKISSRSIEKTNDDPTNIVEMDFQRPNNINQENINQRTLFNNPTMKNNVQLNNFGNTQPRVLQPYSEYSNQYDYEYDNHRIYATQQLKSESSSQVPIEEIMQEECSLLAPNGFSLHMSNGQSLVIGLAYTLTSLSGIPASGASLNPARSFGPAFIMNRWDNHWIYWLGPVLGAVIAGFFYEFVFSPTRKSSLCYRPKLFRFSAHDMAKVVGPKSRLYQQQQQKLAAHQHQQQQQQQMQHHQQPPQTTFYRPQTHLQSIHQSPLMRTALSNPISNTAARQQTHWSSQLFPVFNTDNHGLAARGGGSGGGTTAPRQASANEQVVYDDPTIKVQHHATQFATSARQAPSVEQQQPPMSRQVQANHRRSLILPPSDFCARASPEIVVQRQTGKPFAASTVHSRPMSMALDASNLHQRNQQRLATLAASERKCESLDQLDDDLYHVLSEPPIEAIGCDIGDSLAMADHLNQHRIHIRQRNAAQQQRHHHHHQQQQQQQSLGSRIQRPMSGDEPDYSNSNITGNNSGCNGGETASDSGSQRTNEMVSSSGLGGCGPNGPFDRSSSQSQNSVPLSSGGSSRPLREYGVEYYN